MFEYLGVYTTQSFSVKHLSTVWCQRKASAGTEDHSKLSIIEKKYDIPIEGNLREDVSAMCNLSEGIEEKGRAEGLIEGEAGLIQKMYKNGMSAEQIASATEKTIEEVETIISSMR